jgi:hypothetical protein
MRRIHYVLALTFLSLLACNFLSAQTVDYATFTIPMYRYAQDQRYSEHKKVLYTTNIDEKLGASLFPQRGREFRLDSFFVSVMGELVNAGIELRITNNDLNVVFDIQSFSVTTTNSTTMMGNTTYNVEGKAKVFVLDEKNEPLEIKPVSLSELVQLQSNEVIKNNFTKSMSNQNAIINYTLLVRAIKNLAFQAEDSYINAFKKRQVTLANISRAQKKYPELTFFDSLNVRLVNELNTKAVTDYKQFIVPYETEITTFINKEFPKGYDVKNIKLAGYYTLAYLYYLAYDNIKLKQAMDFLYENSNKVFGNRLQYNERKPLMTEVEAYYSSLNLPKIIPGNTSAK